MHAPNIPDNILWQASKKQNKMVARIFSRIMLGGGGGGERHSAPPPVSYAYVRMILLLITMIISVWL